MDLLLKFGLSTVLGLIIGLEREMKRKPVGLKTSLVISIVSCLLTVVSIESAYKATGSESGVSITMDPLRLAAQIVSGIGFLGAGVILRRGNDTISNLTTAAIIWGAAGIGIAVGAGFYTEAIVGVILIIISVEFLPFVMTFIGPKQLREKEVSLEIVVAEKKNIESVIDTIDEKKVSIYKLRIRDLKDGNHAIYVKVGIHFKMKTTDFYYLLSHIEGVKHVDLDRID
ncbi:MgtC/SapB family protein [Fervidibacillus albus]|uniref:MgtC/SapB family protein n=2 Tax=Fervidibacillus albus TaxID=2980026 RepID=A0A9E8LY50_9BACI|nr:MgtC/SapB family protein [Fervidibacillus albus]WAA11186.1 MgtC/SapB family protein [Fervidibacillus albus]